MAGARDEQDQFAAELTSCLSEHGWVVDFNVDGTFSFTPQSATEASQFQTDMAACSQAARPDDANPDWMKDKEALRAEYAKMLDTRRCLVARGHSIAPPPAEDDWVVAVYEAPDTAWLPFYDLLDESRESFFGAFEACPQSGLVVTWPIAVDEE